MYVWLMMGNLHLTNSRMVPWISALSLCEVRHQQFAFHRYPLSEPPVPPKCGTNRDAAVHFHRCSAAIPRQQESMDEIPNFRTSSAYLNGLSRPTLLLRRPENSHAHLLLVFTKTKHFTFVFYCVRDQQQQQKKNWCRSQVRPGKSRGGWQFTGCADLLTHTHLLPPPKIPPAVQKRSLLSRSPAKDAGVALFSIFITIFNLYLATSPVLISCLPLWRPPPPPPPHCKTVFTAKTRL